MKHLEGRLARTNQELDKVTTRKEYALGVWLPGSRSRRTTVLDQPSGTLDLGGGKRLHYPQLHLAPDDRVGITGGGVEGTEVPAVRGLPRGREVEPDGALGRGVSTDRLVQGIAGQCGMQSDELDEIVRLVDQRLEMNRRAAAE